MASIVNLDIPDSQSQCFYRFLFSEWERLALYAYSSYVADGRGVILAKCSSKDVGYRFSTLADLFQTSEELEPYFKKLGVHSKLTEFTAAYNPELEIVFAISFTEEGDSSETIYVIRISAALFAIDSPLKTLARATVLCTPYESYQRAMRESAEMN